MGRRKLEVELIPKKGSRILTFNKRKESLKKQLDQLKILCGVDACMVIYGEHRAVAEVYPSDDLHRTFQIIDDYRLKKDDPTKCKRFGLPDYFEERTKKAEEELAKLRKQNMNAKYPIPLEMIDEEKDPFVLREFANQLLAKSRDVKSRIESLKGMNQFPSSSHDGSEYSFSDLLMDGDYVNSPLVSLIDQNQILLMGGDYVNSPLVSVIDQNQSGGDYPFVMENDEGRSMPLYTSPALPLPKHFFSVHSRPELL